MLNAYNMFGLEDQIGTRVHFMSPGFGERVGGAPRSPEQSRMQQEGRRRRKDVGLSPDGGKEEGIDAEWEQMKADRAMSDSEEQNEQKKAA